jgi:hypothetical protein
MPNFKRGAKPSPRHKLAGATPHVLTGPTPEDMLRIPSKLSMWLNDIDGDCVTAEEAFAKACWLPEIFITPEEVQTWATAHGVLNGAVISEVLEWMQTKGFVQAGISYYDGPHVSVDWTNAELLRNAIHIGPVKIGVAADQLQNVVVGDPPANGWIATGFSADQNEDHCVSLCGFGTMSWLAERLEVKLPGTVDPSSPSYGLFTWSSIGIIDVPSMLAITSEAWLRKPTTVIRPIAGSEK